MTFLMAHPGWSFLMLCVICVTVVSLVSVLRGVDRGDDDDEKGAA